MESIRDRAAIVGIGATPFTEHGGRSSFRMACEAIQLAIADAGLKPEDIDGLTKHATNALTEMELLRAFGWENLRYLALTPWGNAANAIGLAAQAVATGHANYVADFHSITYGHGHTYKSPAIPARVNGDRALYSPFGLVSISSWGALYAQRYLHQYGADWDTLGWVSVAAHQHGATNPQALRYGHPLTIEGYRRTPYVVEPFRVPDLNLSNDGACAVVIASAERARDLKQRPAYIMGATSGTGGRFTEHVTSFNRPDLTVSTENQDLMRELTRQTGLAPSEIDAAQIYDHMSIFVLLALEGLGFCGLGEAKDFVKGGERISLGGELPVNTHGGHLAEAYVNSANHVLEAVRQVRGTAANQVADAKFVLVESGNGLPSSAIILRR